ncbi:hypothetical protein FA15DRAFT_585788 [Coprinopsis marcescibilis]|uniref:Uncharacterized protein n=1 Tax=Coprinopsis marcescibilis TaxID=230819 RepID=A0A5C3L3U1_COPMA|nr:hypothetical protein FA15DRAFT_585788 [Coprinopsis marcescibilis]
MSSPERTSRRLRRLSTASSTSSTSSTETESIFSSSSSSLSSNSSLDTCDVKRRFFSVQNITLGNMAVEGDSESPNIKFVALPDRTMGHSSPGFLPLELEAELNPKAQPFVPRFSTPLLFSNTTEPQHSQDVRPNYNQVDFGNPPPPPGLLQPSQPQTPGPEFIAPVVDMPFVWYPFFVEGLGCADLNGCQIQAEAIISSLELWSNEDFAALASQFCWNAYSNPEDISDAGAYFASCLLEVISQRFEHMVGQTFLWYLRQYAVKAFDSSFDPAVFNQTAEQSTPHVLGAISVARFIADLYAHGLVTTSHVVPCLNRLVAISSTQEHVVAIGYLITRCGPDLWVPTANLSPEPANRFLPKLYQTAKRSQISLLGNEPGYCQDWVDVVTSHITKWEAQAKLRKRSI